MLDRADRADLFDLVDEVREFRGSVCLAAGALFDLNVVVLLPGRDGSLFMSWMLLKMFIFWFYRFCTWLRSFALFEVGG